MLWYNMMADVSTRTCGWRCFGHDLYVQHALCSGIGIMVAVCD